jgi:preprotein translocase subunit SecG
MNTFLSYSQIAVAFLLIVSILLQQRGEALGSAFGGTGGFYGTRRGIQKKIFWATVVLGTLFVVISILTLIIK